MIDLQPTKGTHMIRKLLATTAAAVTIGALGAAPAAQASADGCYYPQVCLYAGTRMSRPVARFRDVTSGWQWLGRSFGTRGVRNTRLNDVAYLLTTGGRVICVPPGARAGLYSGGFTAIRISWRSHC
jgi:hypothetical protein